MYIFLKYSGFCNRYLCILGALPLEDVQVALS